MIKLPNKTVAPTIIKASRGLSLPDFGELWRYRDLLTVLIVRDIRLRYKQAALGVAWVVLQPIITALIFAVIFGRFAKMPSDGVPYLLFAFLGVVGWQIINTGLTKAIPSLVLNQNLVSKVYFPKIMIPMASCLGVLLDVAVSLVLVAGMMVAFHIEPTIKLLVLPFALALMLLVSISLGLMLSALSVSNRDFMQAAPFVLQIWQYLTPVAYASSIVPEKYDWLYGLNPAVLGVQGIRWAVVGKAHITSTIVISSVSSTIVLFVLGLVVFRSTERKFADII